MPKPMKLMIEVEEVAHGRVFRMLDGTPGVVTITPIGDGPRSGGGSTGQKQGGTQSAACLLLAALIRTPGITVEQMRPVLEGNGKRASTLAGTLASMKKAGEIRASGSGKSATYRITKVGQKRYDTACQIQSKE
jgi:hypothetical protein